MIIIATANNNENLNNIKISLDNSISLGQLLDRDDVRAFFHNASKEPSAAASCNPSSIRANPLASREFA